ncbi:hypothetical protein C8R44DRAFT_991135 [Mycena epipterygia]|nr:hypothetical protein C8R44DRAFT_991135 [Mycena epipterygia]
MNTIYYRYDTASGDEHDMNMNTIRHLLYRIHFYLYASPPETTPCASTAVLPRPQARFLLHADALLPSRDGVPLFFTRRRPSSSSFKLKCLDLGDAPCTVIWTSTDIRALRVTLSRLRTSCQQYIFDLSSCFLGTRYRTERAALLDRGFDRGPSSICATSHLLLMRDGALILGVQCLSSRATALLILMRDGALSLPVRALGWTRMLRPPAQRRLLPSAQQCLLHSVARMWRLAALPVRTLCGCERPSPRATALLFLTSSSCATAPSPHARRRPPPHLARRRFSPSPPHCAMALLSSRVTAPSSSSVSFSRDGAPLPHLLLTRRRPLLTRDSALLLTSRDGASPPCAMALLSSRAMAPSSSSESSATALLCLFHATTCLSLLRDNAPPPVARRYSSAAFMRRRASHALCWRSLHTSGIV